jgi:hypothetical protein
MFRLAPFLVALILLAMIGYMLSRPALNEGALEQTRQAILAQPFACPAGLEEELVQWFLDGYVRRCLDGEGSRQGPMLGWRAGRLVVEGGYRDDERDGEWLWYGPDGVLERHERFALGEKRQGGGEE